MIEVPPPTSIWAPRSVWPPSSRDRAPGRGAVEGGLHLARHRLRGRMTYEIAHVGGRIGGHVEELVLGDARKGVAGDVADRVAAALARGEPGVSQLADRSLGVEQRHVVNLDVLPRRDVSLAQRRILLDHAREGLELLGCDRAEGKLGAHHLDVRLALTVDALLEAEFDELLFVDLAGKEARGLGLEVIELALQDRDHVAGHVPQHLRVRERPATVRRPLGDRCCVALHQGSTSYLRLSPQRPSSADARREYNTKNPSAF